MITITLKPLHLAIIAAFVGGILVAGAAVFAFSGSDDQGQTTEQPSLANVDEPPTPVPTSPPSATPEPSPEPTDTPEPTPEEKDEPEIRSCAEIEAAGTYNSPEERQFFLDNCTSSGPSSNPAPAVQDDGDDEPAPPSSSSSATADEQHYRGRATAIVTSFAIRIDQWYNSPSHGVTGDILDFGVLMRRFALELESIQVTPPRFQQVHDQLVVSLVALADFINTFINVNIESESQVLAWIDEYLVYAEAMVAALDDFALVLGIELPPGISGDS